MPKYMYPTSVKAPTGVALRWDTDTTGTSPAVVYANAEGALIDQSNPRQMVHSGEREGAIRTLFGDNATVYVRQMNYDGSVVAGVIATITGVALASPGDAQTAQQAAEDAKYVHGVPWLTLPAGWDTAWKAAKTANAGQLAVIGDSLASGRRATDMLAQGFFGLLRTALLARGLPLAGDYYPVVEYSVSQSPDTSALGSTATPWGNIQGGVTIATYDGGFQRCFNLNGSAVFPHVTFTTPYGATGIDLIYVDFGPASSTFAYTVDGGSTQTVTITGPDTNAGAVIKKLSITGLNPASTHSIAVGTNSSGHSLMLVGATARTGNSGFFFTRHVCGGISARAMATPGSTGSNTGIPNTGTTPVPSFPLDKIGPLGAQTSSINFTGVPTQPDAAIIELGVNDISGGFNVYSYMQALEQIVYALRAGKADCSIAFVIPCMGNSLYSDQTFALASNSQLYWVDFKAAMHKVAAAYKCAVVDIDTKWGNTPGAAGFLGSNDIHPTTAGHADIAAVLGGIF